MQLTTTLRSARAQLIVDALDGGTDECILRIYAGTPPAGPAAALAGNDLLSQHVGSDPCAAVSGGVATFDAFTDDTNADNSGVATFARLLDSDLVVHAQLTAGAAGSGPGGTDPDVVIDNPSIVAGQTVTVATGGTITEGNA